MSSLLQQYRKPTEKGQSKESLINRYKSNQDINALEDIAKQTALGAIKGTLGAYGQIPEALGINPKEALTPSQKQKTQSEFESSPEELVNLSSENISPEGTGRLPTQEDINKLFELLGINPEAQTPGGRIAEKGSTALGGAASFGAGGLGSFLASAGATAGQAAREGGAPEWLATAIDMGLSISDMLKSGINALTTKKASVKPSGLSERKFESLEKPTKVTKGTKEKAVESVSKEFSEIAENIQESSNKSLKIFREDPSFESRLSEGYEKLKEAASQLPQKKSSNSYRKYLATEYNKIGKKGFEKTESEQQLRKIIKDSFISSKDKNFTLSELIDQYQKNNAQVKKYAPFGPTAVENEAKREALLLKNRAIAETIEKEFGNNQLAQDFKFLNDRWSEVQKIKTVDSFIDSIFQKDKIDFNKAKKVLYSNKRSRNLENALGKKQFKDFKQLTSDLLDQEKGMKLLKSKGLTLDDIGNTGKAFLFKPSIAKLQLATSYISQLWRKGLSNPKYTHDWSQAIKLFNKGQIGQAVSLIEKITEEKDED